MSNKSKIPSPARSQGFITPRRRTRRTLSSVSTAQSEGPMSSVVEEVLKSDKFILSPMKRRSVLPDDTDIEAPRRASWWKRLEGSTRDVLEALDTNKMTDNLLLEEYEFEVEKDDKQSQSAQQSQSSDNESVASIVVPQRRLFNRNKQTQPKFGDIMGASKSLGKTNIEDQSIEVAPKNLFNKRPRNRPVFPAALLNSTNKTVNKTVEPEINGQTRPNLFGQAGKKRKNIFTDFVLSDSEEDSDVQHKVFCFKKNNDKRLSVGTRSRRMPSLTPSMTTEIDIDDWNLLPSSTMIGAQETSRVSDKDMGLQDENQDDTLTEHVSHKCVNLQAHKSVIQDDENDKTLTNENIEDANKSQDVGVKDVSEKVNKTHEISKTKFNTSVKDKSLQNKSTKQAANVSNAENVQIKEVVAKLQQDNAVAIADKKTLLAENEQSLEDKMAELHGESRPSIGSNKTEENLDTHEAAKSTNQHIDCISKQDLGGSEANKENEDVDMEKSEEREPSEVEQEESEEETEQSEEEQEQSEEEEEQGEEEQERSEEREQIEEEHEPSFKEQESQNQTDEAIKNEDDDMVEKDTSDEEMSQEDQDEEMEEMVWHDNDNEKLSDAAENEVATKAEQQNKVVPNQKRNDISKNLSRLDQNAEKRKNISNKSHKIVDASVDNHQNEEDVVEETPNNSPHDTTGRSRKTEVSKVKSPEAVLQNMTNDNESFRPIGRSTTFRKSKSVYETMNMRHSLAPLQESTLGSEGSRNSSTEGSEWDSHRTTRKTIRQTLGKEYTTRKSLRALVMEQSAKRQTELYNKTLTKFDKTKNKTVTEYGNKKNASKMNKTKNKTVVDDGNNENASTINRTRNKTVINDANSHNESKIVTKENIVLDDINDQYIRRLSNSNISRNGSPILESHVHDTSTHHVPDPLISTQVSYHKSVHDIKEAEIYLNLSNPEESVNISITDNNDSGPEISMNASYGEGMSAFGNGVSGTSDKVINKDISRGNTSIRSKSIHYSEEILDYEASEQVISSLDDQEPLQDERDSEPENEEEMEQSEQEIESEQEDSQSEMEANSEHETRKDEPQEIEDEKEQFQQEIESDQQESEQETEDEQGQSQLEIESDQEKSQQEIEDEQEQSQQEIESDQEESQQQMEDEQEQSQQEIESDQEKSQQEIEDEQEQSQQEIESDQEESQQQMEDEQEQSQQEIESDQDESQQELEQQSENEDDDMSQDPQESYREIREPENLTDQDDDDFLSALNSEYKTPKKRGVSRIVFDSNMMSDEEIDFVGVSRQTDNDINENNESEREPDLSTALLQRVSEPRDHDMSVGTKKSWVMMQCQKIEQENMERRQKIKEKVEKRLNLPRNYDIMSPIQLEYSNRRVIQPEPRKPKPKPKPTGIPKEALPKAFLEDLKYKPPKRFQPSSAPWITKRLYKYLETKLEPKYDYRARVRAEELVQNIFNFTKLVRRCQLAPPHAVDELKREMARLRIVNTHYEFYDFFHEFMPREIRIKVNPDIVNKIPMPRNGVFSDILMPSPVK